MANRLRNGDSVADSIRVLPDSRPTWQAEPHLTRMHPPSPNRVDESAPAFEEFDLRPARHGHIARRSRQGQSLCGRPRLSEGGASPPAETRRRPTNLLAGSADSAGGMKAAQL